MRHGHNSKLLIFIQNYPRRDTGFGSEQLASTVNESLDIEYKNIRHIPVAKSHLTTSWTDRHSVVDAEAEKEIIKEYKSFGQDKPDKLEQADLIRFNDTNINYGR